MICRRVSTRSGSSASSASSLNSDGVSRTGRSSAWISWRALRHEFRQAHEAYLAAHAHMIMARGPLVTDDGETPVGSVLLLDVPDMDTAWAFFEKEPFYSSGVYQEINCHRWRFGRVMDRFK